MKGLVAFSFIHAYAAAFSPSSGRAGVNIRSSGHTQPSLSSSSCLFSSSSSSSPTASSSNVNANVKFNPVFDFTSDNEELKAKAVGSFERIDDAIMGGISLSALKDVPNEKYASWSGVCRTDGGGFCGMRTLPFVEPLSVTALSSDDETEKETETDGIYVKCQLASDDEPERRVWKMTVRTDTSRGEQVYQAMFDLAEAMNMKTNDSDSDSDNDSVGDDGMATVKVPFSSFQMVRGPRLVPNGPPLDVSNGLYQIGMTMSKFAMGVNTTELENFRPGYFELQIKEIGFYQNVNVNEVKEAEAMKTVTSAVVAPDTLTKEEVAKRRPLPLKIMLPILKLFFSEKANRRKSALNILRSKRNMTRIQAIVFGIKSRSKSIGLVPSIMKTMSILSVDVARVTFFTLVKVCIFTPLKLVRRTINTTKKALGMSVKTRVNTPAE